MYVYWCLLLSVIVYLLFAKPMVLNMCMYVDVFVYMCVVVCFVCRCMPMCVDVFVALLNCLYNCCIVNVYFDVMFVHTCV